jgi:hypothetical protein
VGDSVVGVSVGEELSNSVGESVGEEDGKCVGAPLGDWVGVCFWKCNTGPLQRFRELCILRRHTTLTAVKQYSPS